MAAKKRNSGKGRRRSSADLPDLDTRDPGMVGNIGCWAIFAALLVVVGMIAVYEYHEYIPWW